MKYRQAKKMLKNCKRVPYDIKAWFEGKRVSISVDLSVRIEYPRKYRHGAVESALVRKVRLNLPRLIMRGRTVTDTCRQIVNKYPGSVIGC